MGDRPELLFVKHDAEFWCLNTAHGTGYVVTQDRCECPAFKFAHTCKHHDEALLRHIFEQVDYQPHLKPMYRVRADTGPVLDAEADFSD